MPEYYEHRPGPANYFPTTNPSGVTKSPLGVWWFDNAADYLNDRTANGRNFSVATGAFEFVQDPTYGLWGAYFGSGDHELVLPLEEAIIIAQNELGTDDASLTLEAIINPEVANGCVFNLAGAGESLATNYLWTLGEESSGYYSSFLEYGGGANASVVSDASVVLNALQYVAMTISADGLLFKWYRNGVLIGSGTATHRAEKNSAGGNTQRIRVGRRDDDSYDFTGTIYALRITDETFDDAAIAEANESITGFPLKKPEADQGAIGFEEQIVLPTSTSYYGPTRSPLEVDHGYVQPIDATPAFEELVEFPALTDGVPRHGAVGTVEAPTVPVKEVLSGSFDEQVEMELFEGPDYMDTKNDGDGKETLDGLGLNAMVAADLTLDPWNVHGTGWYGAARDGTFYYNGEECTPSGPSGTSFGTIASGKNRRCWPLWGTDPPLDNGATGGATATLPADDTLRLAGTSLSSAGTAVCTALGWKLDGDFDISVDLSALSESGGSDGGISLIAKADNDNLFYVRRRCSGGVGENGRWDKDVRINGSYGNYSFVDAAGATSGKFRLVRSGNLVSSYYWTTSWVQIGSSVDMGRAEPMQVSLSLWGVGGLTMQADFSNFVITSGTVLNKAAWVAEASGTHRGILDECPLRHLMAATDATLNILDTDNDKLWMRFIEGSGMTLNPSWSSSAELWIHRIKFREGVLLLAWHGAMIRIDFGLGDARIARSMSDTNRGAVKLTTHGNGYHGWFADSPTNSHIITRNTVTNWSTPSQDEWAVPDNDVNDCDLWFDGGYEYRVAATESGLRVYKWRRWYFAGSNEEAIATPDWSYWDTANDVEWVLFDQSSGELFWHDRTNMYSAPKTSGGSDGWEDRMDESLFPAAVTKALPGTREWRGQYVAVKYGSYIFIPADEGVYRINWPSGSWELFYGNAASAATHKVLPNYSFPTALALGVDGTTDVLVVGMYDGTAVVKLTDNTLHSQTPAKANQRVDVVAA